MEEEAAADGNARNHEILRALREVFEPLAEQLTPEVEPAAVVVLRQPDGS
jgi:hypothetical protein